MVLLFMAEGCSKRTMDSTEQTELVAGMQEAEEWGQETSERETSEETADSESGRRSGTEAMEVETEGRGQNKSKADIVSGPVAEVSTEDREALATTDSGKGIPVVSVNAPKEDSRTSVTTAAREAGQSFSMAPLEPSVPASPEETEPAPTNRPETQTEPETPAETSSATEPKTEPETEAPPETEPKTAYDYPFDMDSIRSDCIGIGQGMGLALDGSLTPGNAAWWNPVTASRSNQGAGLKQSLKSYVTFHTPGNLAGYGMDEITVFNIYCEPRGNGEYSVYFLFG